MSFSDTPSGKMLFAISIMLVILPVEVQFNVNYKES